ncbi:MAG: Homoserine dehydrogenase [Thermoanaerobacterales bacterium 50_218]|nr:MAG: Homoserine dehydrogenase [Thermoanaerobacterales bacterium 50_218]HAA89497.1 homoserine dehydrogenase [Peptococcaceae bacterium]
MNSEVVGIGLLGVGTVGSGVVKMLRENSEEITQRLGKKLIIKKVLERDPEKPRRLGIPLEIVTNSFDDVLGDPEVKIVVELLGGIEPARQYIIQALRQGKHVVTANKDVVAAYGKELFEAATAGGADLYFEASVGGGIPIIRVLKESLAANKFEEVIGIVNGTTNYILTRMSEEGIDFGEALRAAQEAGYAEADPAADIEGLDAARKIAILASIAFNTRVLPDDVFVEGITRITPEDIEYARELGYCVKLLAIARQWEEEVEVRVHPAFLPNSHPLAAVNGVFNAIFVRGNAVGETMFYGQGAGQMPTASAVVGDIMQVVRNMEAGSSGRFSCTCYLEKKVRPRGKITSKYYIRLIVKDRPGVLASIAGVFGNHNVSLASVIQKRTITSSEEQMAEIVLITHEVEEQNLQDALTVISGLSVVGSVENVIRVERG